MKYSLLLLLILLAGCQNQDELIPSEMKAPVVIQGIRKEKGTASPAVTIVDSMGRIYSCFGCTLAYTLAESRKVGDTITLTKK